MNSTPPARQHHPLPDDSWRRLAAGDERALRTAWLAYGGTAMALALRMVGASAAAEEVVAWVFAELWRQAPSRQLQHVPVEEWLLWTVWRRARGRRGPRVGSSPMAEGLLPLESVRQRQRRRQLTAALARLAPEVRGGLERAWFDGVVDAGVDTATMMGWLAQLPPIPESSP
jgi:RNA polymerase sigma-70 factor (ECF subfamily)